MKLRNVSFSQNNQTSQKRDSVPEVTLRRLKSPLFSFIVKFLLFAPLAVIVWLSVISK